MVRFDICVESDSILNLLYIFVFMAFTNISKLDSEYSLSARANSNRMMVKKNTLKNSCHFYIF